MPHFVISCFKHRHTPTVSRMLWRTSGGFDDSFNEYWILGEPLGDKRNALWDGQSSTELVHIAFLVETIVEETVK